MFARWQQSLVQICRTLGEVAFVGVGSLLLAACAGTDPLLLCGEIPDGGCTIGRGGTCDDETCAGLYDCVDGKWVLDKTCPATTTTSASSSESAAASTGSTSCGKTVMLDHSDETSGCSPDLQNPDCPAEVAETCSPCLTGCDDFFMCEKAGWTHVAYCSDAGNLVVDPAAD